MLSLVLAFLTVATGTEATQVTEADVLAYGKRLDVHRIDARLRSARYQDWLQRALGPDATIRWAADDCAEGRSGEDDVPVCLTADARLRPRGRVSVSVAVGSVRGGLGSAAVFFGSIEGLGPSEAINQGDLPGLAAKVRASRARATKLARLPDVLVDDTGWIGQVLLMPAARLDPRLPGNIAFGDWIAGRAGPGAKADWYIAGCGAREGHGGPPVDLTGDNDEWAFVAVEFQDADVDVIIEVRLGTCRKGPFGKPVIARAHVRDKRPHHDRVDLVSLDELDAMLSAIRARTVETLPPR
jgi:hypothetical protein